MAKRVNRREFVLSGAAAVVGAASVKAVAAQAPSPGQAPVMMVKKSVKPVVISSNNGNIYKNGGDITGVAKAFNLMIGGSDVLDALIAGVNLCELDPADTSVGFGGMPNADGVVQLDSSCMHGPKKRAGAVACLEGVRTPSLVAKAVMESTDHHLLVGKGAQDFARNMGFTIEADLNTERSRKLWLEWKRRADPEHYLDPIKRSAAYYDAGLQMVKDGLIEFDHFWGTINCDGVSPKGEICGVTTTSGLAWKIPGRVGDSPILGAGSTSTGRSARRARPGAARRTSTTSARSSSSRTCGAGWRRKTPGWRRSSASGRTPSRSGCSRRRASRASSSSSTS